MISQVAAGECKEAGGMRNWTEGTAALWVVLILLWSVTTAQAATITVNSLADPGSGNCTTTCTLRDAIATASANDEIIGSVLTLDKQLK
jgi:CSLREA domain-containing protein